MEVLLKMLDFCDGKHLSPLYRYEWNIPRWENEQWTPGAWTAPVTEFGYHLFRPHEVIYFDMQRPLELYLAEGQRPVVDEHTVFPSYETTRLLRPLPFYNSWWLQAVSNEIMQALLANVTDDKLRSDLIEIRAGQWPQEVIEQCAIRPLAQRDYVSTAYYQAFLSLGRGCPQSAEGRVDHTWAIGLHNPTDKSWSPELMTISDTIRGIFTARLNGGIEQALAISVI